MSRRHTLAARAVAALGAVVLLVSCGVPQDSTTRTIDAADVPYGLLDEGPDPAPEPTPTGPAVTVPQVYFLDQDEQLAPQAQPLGAEGREPVVSALLAALAAGPTEEQRRRGLGTAFGPDVGLRLGQVVDGVASVEVALSSQGPAADRLPLAIGQLVLTVASVDGVAGVRVLRDGVPVEAPLPGGERTSRPLTPADYLGLLTPAAERVQRTLLERATASPSPTGR